MEIVEEDLGIAGVTTEEGREMVKCRQLWRPLEGTDEIGRKNKGHIDQFLLDRSWFTCPNRYVPGVWVTVR